MTLLYDDKPLVVSPRLAMVVGLNEAIVLQQVHYWTLLNERTKKNCRGGFYWTYNTYAEWQEQFPFWSVDTIKRIFKKLRDANLLVVERFNKMPTDRTTWYRVNHACISHSAESHFRECGIAPCIVADCTNAIVQIAPMLPETTSEISAETTTDSDDEENLTDVEFQLLRKQYEEATGTLMTPLIAEQLQEAMKSYEFNAIVSAISLTAKNADHPSWKYIASVLTNGEYRKPKPKKEGPPHKNDPDRFLKGKYGHMVNR